MTEWFRQHRESVLSRMPWHIEDATPTRAALLEARTAIAAVLEVGPDRLDVVC